MLKRNDNRTYVDRYILELKVKIDLYVYVMGFNKCARYNNKLK